VTARYFGRLTGDGFDVYVYDQVGAGASPPIPSTSSASATDYRATVPNTTLVYLPGGGHNRDQDRPAEVLGVLRAFLDEQPLPIAPLGDALPDGYQGPP